MKHRRTSALAIAAALAALSTPAVAQGTVRDGIEAWQSSDYSAAVAIWRPLAEKGDSDAAFNLGQAYRLGRGVSIDLAVAQKWLVQAANAGHLDAQTMLGLLLFDSGSRDVALQWLKRAAERGEPRAMLVYGMALFNGDGVQRDPVLAYAYVSRSAAQGLEPARSTLAELDNILPVEVRKQGVAVALSKVKTKPPPRRNARPAPAQADKPAAVGIANPTPKPAEKPPPAALGGTWRVQLGAFSRRASAEALYRKLSASAPVAGQRAFYVPAGPVIRLQVGEFATRSTASAACAMLAGQGQACFVVESR